MSCNENAGSGSNGIGVGRNVWNDGYYFSSEANLEGENLFSNAWSYFFSDGGADFTLYSSVLAAIGCANHYGSGPRDPQSIDGGTNGTWTEFAKLDISPSHASSNPSINMFRANLQPGTYRLRCDSVWSTGVFLRKAGTGYDL